MRHSILVAVEGSKAAPKGLEGVVATTTAICSVSDNFLQYRGYRIEELVGKAEYEEVAYLLLNGDLPDKALGHAANSVKMARLDANPRAAEILNACFILQAEHGLNASTFTARVVAGTNADMHAAVTAAFGALKGPLHGGATDRTMRMLEEIGSPTHVETFVDKAIQQKYKFSGFGHRVYLSEDPRAKHLRKFAMELAKDWKGKPYFEIQERLAKAIAERRPKMSPSAAAKVNVVNVDYYAATTYTFLGIPADLGTSIFALGRIAGWSAHIMEQHGDNRLIRPESEYTGPSGKRYIPIAER